MIALADLLSAERTGTVARHGGRDYSFAEFRAAVDDWRESLSAENGQKYALFCHDAYPFAVLLCALWHAGKQVWLAANNRPGTAQQLQQAGCRLIGDWQAGFDCRLDQEPTTTPVFGRLQPDANNLAIFTSGSTGAAKSISKSLRQLQAEVDTLERLWGRDLAGSRILATVSQQHIYGLLFRVLWPLAAGRTFHSETALDAEHLAQQAAPGRACWVASPAHLKRLAADAPWPSLAGLSAIFSSGGPLPAESAAQIERHCGRAALEIYGSSETGGIAWRRYPDPVWQLFDGLSIDLSDGKAYLSSPYLPDENALELDDRLDLQSKDRFLLHGRRDRIVKIEEKRLSLTELERHLADNPWLSEVHALALAGSRDQLAVCAVLSAAGNAAMAAHGRKALIGKLKEALQPWFEAVLIPRKWLFLSAMPTTVQAKLDSQLLQTLLQSNDRMPLLQTADLQPDTVVLGLKVPRQLRYFADHFPGYPILPGVVQIGWAEHFGKQLFNINAPFSRLEAVKFAKPVRPDYELQLTLDWRRDSNKLNFRFSQAEQVYSSGRLTYAADPS
ncbi:AMP-binding protein [Methylomonas koyamae]|uniref:AMP-binding protein n=1 Tax=Methylomonas koyamae TaxID=702114 RepID=UPI0011264D7A|nr:AMP-binding protein [Methylomonas koyamae]TPQ24399.1 AMP-dependent synthetase [Methylomonas koyamae]